MLSPACPGRVMQELNLDSKGVSLSLRLQSGWAGAGSDSAASGLSGASQARVSVGMHLLWGQQPCAAWLRWSLALQCRHRGLSTQALLHPPPLSLLPVLPRVGSCWPSAQITKDASWPWPASASGFRGTWQLLAVTISPPWAWPGMPT